MASKNIFAFLVILFTAQTIVSCKDKPEPLLDEDLFVNITAELMVIEKLNLNESEKSLLAVNVFKKYNVPSEQYLFTKEHFKNDPAFWANVYKRVQLRIKDMINRDRDAQKSPNNL